MVSGGGGVVSGGVTDGGGGGLLCTGVTEGGGGGVVDGGGGGGVDTGVTEGEGSVSASGGVTVGAGGATVLQPGLFVLKQPEAKVVSLVNPFVNLLVNDDCGTKAATFPGSIEGPPG